MFSGSLSASGFQVVANNALDLIVGKQMEENQ